MKYEAIICLLIILHACQTAAQEVSPLYKAKNLSLSCQLDRAKIDSLISELDVAAEDTLRVYLYNKLSESLHFCKNDSAKFFAEKGLILAQKLKNPRWISYSFCSLGNYYGTFGTMDFAKALESYFQQAEVAKANGLDKIFEDAISCILNIYFYTGDFSNAMKISTQGMALAEKKSDSRKIAHYSNLLGFIYLRQGNPQESKKFYQQYFETAAAIGDSTMMSDATIGMAEVLVFEKKPEQAMPMLLQAHKYLVRGFKRIGIKAEKIPYTLFKIATACGDMGEHEKALAYCLRGFKFSEQFPFNVYDVANYYIITGKAYENVNQMKRAIETFHLGLSLSLQIRHAENVRDAYEALSRIYERQKMYDSAFYYSQRFSFMKDSISNVRVKREIEKVNAEYNIEKKDQEIKQQQQLHVAEIARQNIIALSIVAFFLLVIIIAALLYNRYRLKQRSLFQTELNRKQNELFNTITSIQDKERKRIAQDIHDQVGSVLSAAKLQLSGLEELKVQLSDDQKRKYGSAMALMDRAAEELRNISHNLMPATLSRLGLIAALRGLFDKMTEHSNLKVNFNSHGFEKRIEEPTEINIYAIVLELISNVVKHAHANQATIQLIRYPTYINISVEDDGRGFNVERVQLDKSGIGMRNLISRIEYLNGTLHIDSSEGQGTTVMIDIPLSA
jgi:two-component system NarL family sensor kinase